MAWNASHIEADQPVGFRIIGADTDSPNLRLRPLPDRSWANWLQATVEVYGGALSNSWLDRDLGISGRMCLAIGPRMPSRFDSSLPTNHSFGCRNWRSTWIEEFASRGSCSTPIRR